MVNRPSVPEIITVNSEDLQATIRDLLPSQNGFGSELQATNVITPIIDLTPTAQGSILPQELQDALAFGSQTSNTANNSTVTLANTPGFWRLDYNITAVNETVAAQSASIGISDGLGTKNITQVTIFPTAQALAVTETETVYVWLTTGDSLTATSTSARIYVNATVRQVADSEGKSINPSGFPL